MPQLKRKKQKLEAQRQAQEEDEDEEDNIERRYREDRLPKIVDQQEKAKKVTFQLPIKTKSGAVIQHERKAVEETKDDEEAGMLMQFI